MDYVIILALICSTCTGVLGARAWLDAISLRANLAEYRGSLEQCEVRAEHLLRARRHRRRQPQ